MWVDFYICCMVWVHSTPFWHCQPMRIHLWKNTILTFSCFCFSLSRTDRELLTFFKSSTSTGRGRRDIIHAKTFFGCMVNCIVPMKIHIIPLKCKRCPAYMKYKVPEPVTPRNSSNAQTFQTGISFLLATFQTLWSLLWKMDTWHQSRWHCL